MAFTPPPVQPDFSRLKTILQETDLQIKNQPLYQLLNQLIDAILKFQALTVAAASTPSGGGTPSSHEILQLFLADIESGEGPMMPPGSGASSVVTTPQRIVMLGMDGYDGEDGFGFPGPAGAGTEDNFIWAPLTDGDPIEPSLIFDSLGNCIMVQEFF